MLFYSTSFCGLFFFKEHFVKRNKKGDIESLTGYAMEVLKKLQTGISYFGWVIFMLFCGSEFACASKFVYNQICYMVVYKKLKSYFEHY